MNRKNYTQLKAKLLKKFNNQCPYCGIKIYDPLMVDIEYFYPKSIYPKLVNDMDNILISCRTCNMIKSNKFPIDKNGNPLLINPLKEEFSDHIIQLDNGYFEGKTEKGKVTIDTLQLNKTSLIELSNKEIEKIIENSQRIEGYESLSKEFEQEVELYMKRHNLEVSA